MEDNKQAPMKFKTFVMLFFQEQLQALQEEKKELVNMQKFYKKSMEKVLPLKDEDVYKHFKDIPDLKNAYEDLLKIHAGEEVKP